MCGERERERSRITRHLEITDLRHGNGTTARFRVRKIADGGLKCSNINQACGHGGISKGKVTILTLRGTIKGWKGLKARVQTHPAMPSINSFRLSRDFHNHPR